VSEGTLVGKAELLRESVLTVVATGDLVLVLDGVGNGELTMVVVPGLEFPGHKSLTKFPCSACPITESTRIRVSPHTYSSVAWILSRPSTQTCEQVFPFVKSLIRQPSICEL